MDEYQQSSNGRRDYILKRKQLSGLFFEISLPNEYLVEVGRKNVKPVLGGKKFRLFKHFLRVPASVQTLTFSTDNANIDYQGIGIDGYATWRIDPSCPENAIRTLDFFDADDPMARTNEELKTICVEAVRHVISNMSIDDALKKKDEIAENLKNQLKEIEKKWGILFDQVGIEKVRIMSDSLFTNLQARFRDSLRLEVERKRIETDREIARENNSMKEKTEIEALETQKKINLTQVETDSRVKETALSEKHALEEKERKISEDNYRKDTDFMTEKNKKDHELSIKQKEMEIEQLKIDKTALQASKEVQEIQEKISTMQLEIERLKREVQQSYTAEDLTAKFIAALPGIYQGLKIDNYTVLDSGGQDKISPAAQFVSELLTLLRGSQISDLFKGKPELKQKPVKKT